MQLVVRDKMKDYGDRGDRLGLLSQARDFSDGYQSGPTHAG